MEMTGENTDSASGAAEAAAAWANDPGRDPEKALLRALDVCVRQRGVIRDLEAELGRATARANCRFLSFLSGMMAGWLVAGLAVLGGQLYDRHLAPKAPDRVRLERAYEALRDLTDRRHALPPPEGCPPPSAVLSSPSAGPALRRAAR